MNAKQLSSQADFRQELKAQALSSSATGTAIATTGYDRVVFDCNVGTLSASATLDIKVQTSSASDGTYTDISGASVPQLTTANDVTNYLIEVDASKQSAWLRVLFDVAGGSASAPASCTAILYRARHMAPSQDQTVIRV